jgi:PAS domain S-box-containing protein
MEVIADNQEANRCIRELTALSLLPAIWIGGKAEQIRESLADALKNSLGAEIIYVRGGGEDSEKTALRLTNLPCSPSLKERLEQAIADALGSGGSDLVAFSEENIKLRLAIMPLGPMLEFGVIAVGSTRPEFPTPSDRILLNVSVNQAIIAFRATKQVAALNRSESTLRAFVENAAVGIHWVGPDGTIIWANQTELNMLGHSGEEYIGRNIAEFHVDKDVIEDVLTRLCRGETLHGREARLRRKDGSICHVLINSNVLFENGRFLHTRCFTHDITERKKAEQALVDASEQRRIALESAALGSWDYRFETGEVIWDERCRNLWGLSKGAALDYNLVLNQIHSDYRESTNKAVEAALAGDNGGSYRSEFPVIWPDGTEHWIASQGQVFFEGENHQRRPIRFIGIARETTQEKRASEILEFTVKERTASLLETTQQLEAFCYTIAHDLRSPLRAQQSYAHLLLDDQQSTLSTTGEEYARRIINSAQRLDQLVNDLLTYSRISRDELNFSSVDLAHVFQCVQRHLQDDIARQNATFTFGPMLSVYAFAPTLQIVVENLVNNALKFVPPGVPPRIHLWSESREHNVRVWVEDNGIGISPENITKIFGVFQRLHKAHEYPGTGIGLAIVEKGIERMGGRVGVESNLGKGSRFWIELLKPPFG